LLIYTAALPFTPINTLLYRTFHKTNDFPWITGGFELEWAPLLLVFSRHKKAIYSIAISPNGAHIASSLLDGTVQVWYASSGALAVEPLAVHEGSVRSVIFSLDSNRVASGSDNGTICVWDLTSGAQFVSANGHSSRVELITFSLDGTHLLSGSNDKTVRFWDL
jgi:WD40 repeat protein